MRSSSLVASLALAFSLSAQLAHAEVAEDEVPTEPTRVTSEERSFVNVADPSTPNRGVASAEYSLGAASGVAALRPLPSASDEKLITHGVTATYGIGYGVAPFVSAIMQQGSGASSTPAMLVGARWEIGDPKAAFRVGIVGGGFREFGATWGVFVRGVATYDVGAWRFGANAHFERAFATGRDDIDFLASAGASYRIVPGLRVGAEWVGQDLEETFSAGAEGGSKHYVGPDVAIDLDHGRAQIVAGPSFGIGASAARVLGRATFVVSF